MFQIATAISLAKNNSDEVAFPEWKYAQCFENNYKSKKGSTAFVFKESGFHYTQIPYRPNMAIDGYFQSEKYFIDNESVVRSFFEPKNEIKEKILNKWGHRIESDCSIHVRRGDYVNLQDHHPLQTVDYYMKAAKKITKSNIGKIKFIVFSDDIEWCKQNFPLDLYDFIFVDDQEDYEDLFMMSMCKHNIIGNSSFSWWGAWLNNNKEKIVISPKNWFGKAKIDHDTKDLYCDDWIKM